MSTSSTEGPQRQTKRKTGTDTEPETVPQPRQGPEQPENSSKKGEDPTPRLIVVGPMGNQIAIRLGWRKGMVPMSMSRFRFLRDELGMDVTDNPDDYLF